MRSYSSVLLVGLIVISASVMGNAAIEPLPWANPWDKGLDYEFVNKSFDSMTTLVTEGAVPGAVGLILKDGHIIARRAVGNKQTYMIRSMPGSEEIEYVSFNDKMMEHTLFDLASLTKMIATTTSVMILVEQGKINLDAPVVQYIPTFGGRAKDKVTVRNLLTHTSGLQAWYPFYMHYIDREDYFRAIDEDFSLLYPPGEKRIYSDIGFIVLGRIVETVSGKRLDHFSYENIFEPLGMLNTGFLPRMQERINAASTEFDPQRKNILKGIVHDENSRIMGGVSGHAGLFSTATDLAVFCQMLLDGGIFNGKRILKNETIKLMLTPQLTKNSVVNGSGFLRYRKQLLGWWGMDDEMLISGIGGLPSKTAYGHTGFTGTALTIDPEHKMAAILLSNAVHPKREDKESSALRKAFFGNVSKALVGEANVNLAE